VASRWEKSNEYTALTQ